MLRHHSARTAHVNNGPSIDMNHSAGSFARDTCAIVQAAADGRVVRDELPQRPPQRSTCPPAPRQRAGRHQTNNYAIDSYNSCMSRLEACRHRELQAWKPSRSWVCRHMQAAMSICCSYDGHTLSEQPMSVEKLRDRQSPTSNSVSRMCSHALTPMGAPTYQSRC